MKSIRKLPLAEVPVASTSFHDDAEFSVPHGDPQLTYVFRRDGVWVRGGLRFIGACAYRHRGESRCTAFHITEAYDTLVEVVPSDWVKELQAAYPSGYPVRDLHHYMIYLDSVGSFEFAATSWEWLSEEPVG